jgi:TM2 domain-containing membrane protein YozV
VKDTPAGRAITTGPVGDAPAPPHQEPQVLKRLGLAAVLVSSGVLTYLSRDIGPDLGTTLATKYAAGTSALAMFVALGVVAISLGVGGVLAIVTGARGLSLAHVSTRKGFLVMWAGANALVLGLLSGNLVQGRDDVFVEWADVPALIAYGLVAGGVVLVRTGWKYDVIGANEALAADTRPPIVYLRSFQDDVRSPVGGFVGVLLKMASWFFPVGFEQELATIMNRVGPFVAVGRPGERLPELGANRFYFRDDEWKARVADLIARARLTVILCGPTPNLWWEIDHVFASVPPRRVVLLIPERGERTRLVEQQLEKRLRCAGALQAGAPSRSFVAWLFGRNQTLGKAVCFADHWTPTVYAIRQVRNLQSVPKILARPFSLYAAPLETAFQQVFAELDIPWQPPGPSRLMAIILALTFGWLGGHLFYLGDRRRALRYLMFFWTMVPIFLSLRDAARLVLIDRREFDRMYHATSEQLLP